MDYNKLLNLDPQLKTAVEYLVVAFDKIKEESFSVSVIRSNGDLFHIHISKLEDIYGKKSK